MPAPEGDRYAIWPDGTVCSVDELADFAWKSDDYRIVVVDDVFDLEKQLTEDDDDASSRPS